MHKSIHNLALINDQIKSKFTLANDPQIIAVSKTYPMSEINPLIENGHIHFGENKVQEAVDKWTTIKQSHEHLKLHMIGKLQTNKVKYVVPLFDYIHSLDNIKLAEKISLEQQKKKFKPKIFIQVNIGEESQKSGIDPMNLASFLDNCRQQLNLDIVGLMCIPPISGDTNKFFKEMHNLKNQHNLSNLSMGMSSDYMEAINHEATFVRIGSKIFGARD